MHLLVLRGTGCHSSRATWYMRCCAMRWTGNDWRERCRSSAPAASDFCEKGPIVKVLPDNTFYTQVKPSDARVRSSTSM